MLQKFELHFDSVEARRVLSALASDERMEAIWEALRKWADEKIESFVESAFQFAHPIILSDMTLPPEKRVVLSRDNYELSITADQFAEAIEKNRPQAAEFWPDPIDEILEKLRDFSKLQSARGLALWSSLADIPTPSQRGRGNRKEIAYGNAMSQQLERLGDLSRESQDMVIAVLTNVVFGHSEAEEIDVERIRARRKRLRRRSTASSALGDKSRR